MNDARDLYSIIMSDIDVKKIQHGLDYFSTMERYSGSEAGEQAAQYLFDQLLESGIDARLYRYNLYRSLPLPSQVMIAGRSFPVTPYVYSGKCTDLHAPLFFDNLSEDNRMPIYGTQRFDNMADKIIITYDSSYEFAVRANHAGALAVLTVWPLHYAHHGTLGSVWGNPEPRDLLLHYPNIPFAELLAADANETIEQLKLGAHLSASLTVQMDTGVVSSSMPVGYIKGKSDQFVLLSCHYDSWHQGMTDNGAANIAVQELARSLQRHQDRLNRSVMIAFWSGHSDGRYAGSTWFYDNHWQDLKDRCVAHVNMDIAGCKGSDSVKMYASCIETDQFLDDVFKDVGLSPITAMPMPRFADQTFFGADVPLSFFPVYTDSNKETGMSFLWWHTKEDTLDKVDVNVLMRDIRVIARITCGLVSNERLPIDNDKFIAFMEGQLRSIQPDLNQDFNLSPLPERLEHLSHLYERWQQSQAGDREINNLLLFSIASTLTRITYTSSSPYQQDPALSQLPFAGLQSAVNIHPATCPPGTYLAVQTQFIRQKNRLIDEIDKLIEKLEATGY